MNKHFQTIIKSISLLIIGTSLLNAQTKTVEVKKLSPRTIISVVKRIEQEYYFVTRNHPMEMTVTGPEWIRVYTRLLWHPNMASSQTYKILLKEQDQEKLLSFTSELSSSARGSDKQSFSKWRSFYLEVPQGRTDYKFTLLEAKSDTVALRFSFEKPTDYKRIAPETKFRELQFVDKERLTNYYEISAKTPVKVKVQGPATLRATCRLNYDYTLEGRQSYTVAASVAGKEWQSKTFRTNKSETGLYKNAADLIPSSANNMYLEIPPGTYLVEFTLKGGLGKSAAVTFASKPKDVYE
ncbi:MAG: hypothetical protein KGZ86_03520 [Candidatus Latescibacteria bacterium]|nr:hypothetical protein [Candidatus Latescibacterota bacterium]